MAVRSGFDAQFIPRLATAAAAQSQGEAGAEVKAKEPIWSAAAPGRVEPKGGEIRIGALTPAIIAEVAAHLNERAKAGDLLVRLEDSELRAKLAASKAEAVLRMRERDSIGATGVALERRKAEDALYDAELALFDAKLDLDGRILDLKGGKASAQDVEQARAAVTAAGDRVEKEQANVKRLQHDGKAPPLTQGEAALAAARAEVAVLRAAFEKTRIRAPIDGNVLEINAKAGEASAPGGESALLVLGDTAHLQLRAEIEERDASKIHPGQAAIVKSEAFPGRSFEARVRSVAPALGAPQLTARNHRRATDIEVLDAILDLADGTPLVPGMRVDVLFKAEELSATSSAIEAK